MTPSEQLLVDTLRRSVAPRLLAGHDPAAIRRELLAQVERSLGKTHAEPALAALIPGRVALAERTLDELLSADRAGRN